MQRRTQNQNFVATRVAEPRPDYEPVVARKKTLLQEIAYRPIEAARARAMAFVRSYAALATAGGDQTQSVENLLVEDDDEPPVSAMPGAASGFEALAREIARINTPEADPALLRRVAVDTLADMLEQTSTELETVQAEIVRLEALERGDPGSLTEDEGPPGGTGTGAGSTGTGLAAVQQRERQLRDTYQTLRAWARQARLAQNILEDVPDRVPDRDRLAMLVLQPELRGLMDQAAATLRGLGMDFEAEELAFSPVTMHHFARFMLLTRNHYASNLLTTAGGGTLQTGRTRYQLAEQQRSMAAALQFFRRVRRRNGELTLATDWSRPRFTRN